MNKIAFLFLVLVLSGDISAQESNEAKDYVFLKSGEVYQGVIIKNDLGVVSLAVIENGETKIFNFQHYEIDRIERNMPIKEEISEEGEISIDKKETYTASQLGNMKLSKRGRDFKDIMIEPQQNQLDYPMGQLQVPSLSVQRGSKESDELDPFAPLPEKRALREWTRDIRGFRGFLEIGYNLGVGNVRNNSVDLSKSIGFQFNPIFYLGVGTSYKISMNEESALPVFINPRLNMTDHEDVNPYWDVKIGYSPLSAKGAYISTSLGSSFVIGKRDKFAINIGLTYSFLKASYYKNSAETFIRTKFRGDYHQFGLTLGFEY